MAERSRDHPAFDYVMRNFEALSANFAGLWIVAHAEGVFRSGPTLADLLADIPPGQAERYAMAYMRPLPTLPPDDDGGWQELPVQPDSGIGQLVRVI